MRISPSQARAVSQQTRIRKGRMGMRYEIKDNAVYFTRAGEWGKVSACGRSAVRFQASPSGPVQERDWTLMPEVVPARAWLEGDRAFLETGDLRTVLNGDGRAEYFYKNDK